MLLSNDSVLDEKTYEDVRESEVNLRHEVYVTI